MAFNIFTDIDGFVWVRILGELCGPYDTELEAEEDARAAAEEHAKSKSDPFDHAHGFDR